MAGVTGAWDQHAGGVGADHVFQLRPKVDELWILCASENQDRDVERGEVIMQRTHGSGTAMDEGGRQACNAIAEALHSTRLLVSEACKERMLQPLVNELLCAQLFHRLGERAVVVEPIDARLAVRDTCGRSNQDQRFHEFGSLQCKMKDDPATHAVTDIDGSAPGRTDEFGSFWQRNIVVL